MIARAIVLVTTALLARNLGVVGFGALTISRTIVGNTGLGESFFGIGITRQVASYRASGDDIKRDLVISTGILVSLLQAILMALLLVGVILVFFDHLFANLSLEIQSEAKTLIYIFLMAILAQIVSITLGRILEGFERFDVLRILEVSFNTLSLMGLALYFMLFPDIPLSRIGLVFLSLEVIRVLMTIIALTRLGIRIKFSPTHWNWSIFKMLLRFGQPLLLAKMSTLISRRLYIILIGILLTVEAVAQFEISRQVLLAVSGIIGILASTLLPNIAHKAVTDPQALKPLFLRGSRYVITTTLCLTILVSYLRSPGLDLWLSSGFAEAKDLVLFSMIAIIGTHLGGISGTLLIGINKHQSIGRFQLLASFVGVVVALAFYQPLGVYAFGLAVVIEYSITTVAYTPIALKSLGIDLGEFLRESIYAQLPLIIFIIALLTGLYYLSPWDMNNSKLGLMTHGLMVGLAMGSLAWYTIVDTGDRKKILRIMGLKRLEGRLLRAS